MTGATRRHLLGSAGFTALAGIAAATLAVPDALAARTDASSVETPPAGRHTEDLAEIERQWASHDGHPDAELIALCEQVIAIEAEWAASVSISSEMDTRDPAYEPYERREIALIDSKYPLIDQINELPTHTPAGFRARARAILCADYGEMERHDNHQGMLLALLRGLSGEAAN
jgi:hypothetical protein